ncbi:alpha/beta hydrolase [Amycolatopsis sp. NPDC051128]|uniref:alpha/beta hydrolase n=1 Tax=Amycolatopsis sp. NPDC051128 TaxID=3155412 RepID=UPI003423400F
MATAEVGVAQRHAAASRPSATATQCSRVYPVCGLRPRSSPGSFTRSSLFVHGDRDTTCAYSSARQAYNEIKWPKAFLTFVGGSHNKLYVLAQFTRHIRPGMQILGTSAGSTAVAHDPAARRLVLVAVNTAASAQTITFDLSRFTTLPTGPITRWSTSTSSGSDRYVQRADVGLDGKTLRAAFAAGQVQTFQLDGVSA